MYGGRPIANDAIAHRRSGAIAVLRGWFARYQLALTLGWVLLIAALGFVALHHLIHHVRVHDIRAAFHAIGMGRVGLALLLTAASYFALTFYDMIALRIIGRPLPWRTAALASFTSYTLSHNLGMALLTGGSARYRIYSAAGLGAPDIARVIATASIAFWGGVLALTGAALALHPGAIMLGGLSLPPLAQRAAGVAMLAALAAYLLLSARGHRAVRLPGWTLPLPGPRQALAQLGVAAVDLATASAALFVLVPQANALAFPAFFLGYALAIVVALLSHVPGGIGIFEAVVVASLPDVDRPTLLAALIAYRALYYLLPLLLGALLFGFHEGRRWRRPLAQAVSSAQIVASGIAPLMLSALVFLGGVVLLVSGSLPAIHWRMDVVRGFLPLPFVEASHLAASLTGTMLLLLAPGLYRRLDGAFWGTRTLLLAGATFSLLKGLDYEEATVMLVIAAVLQWTRPAFYRRTRFTAEVLTPGWMATVAVAVGLAFWIGFFAFKHVDYQSDLWWQFARRGDASRFLRASLAVSILLIGAAFWRLSRPVVEWHEAANAASLPSEKALAMAGRTDALLALTGDKRFLLSESGNAFLMYQVQGHSWIVMGDPVGAREEWADLLWRLRERADAAQGRLLLYQIGTEALPLAVELGMRIVKYGEEARIDLARFTLDGADARPLRYAARRAEREGARFEIVPAAQLPAIMDELAAISGRWLAAKGHGEKAFSVGRFDPEYMARFDCALVRREGRIIAFANIWATADRNEMSVDLMRHDADMPHGTMDYLFIRLMLWAKAQGYRWFTLGLAPLSGLEARRLAPFWAKAGGLLYRHGEALYGFEGLRAYKEKFGPLWEPRFIAGPQGLSLARALIDLQTLVSGGRGSAAVRSKRLRAVRSAASGPEPAPDPTTFPHRPAA